MNIFKRNQLAERIAACANALPKTSFVVVEPGSENPNFKWDRIEIIFAMSSRHAEQIGSEQFNMKVCYALSFETGEDYKQILKLLEHIPESLESLKNSKNSKI